MPLSIKNHSVGNVTVLTCSGRIIQGGEVERLRQRVTDAMHSTPFIVVDLGAVDFVDSSGLGLLARLLDRARAASGNLKLSAVSAKINDVLRVTKLEKIFQTYPTADEAIAAFARPAEPVAAPLLRSPDVLCVDPSADVLAYFRELLRQAGFAAITADNMPDALKLLRTTRPRLVAIGAVDRNESESHAAVTFYKLAREQGLIKLPEGFSTHDAGEVARDLIEQVRTKLMVLTPGRSAAP